MFSSIFGEKLSDDIPYLNIFQKNLSPVLIIDNRPNKLQLVSIINEYNSGPSYGSKDFGGVLRVYSGRCSAKFWWLIVFPERLGMSAALISLFWEAFFYLCNKNSASGDDQHVAKQ